jgi:hypothetical protein
MKFHEYLGKEKENLLISVLNFKEDYHFFEALDEIYQEPLQRLTISKREDKLIGIFYNFVHFYLYFSLSCFLRCHLSECLSSVRKGIDATLSAYKIILDPSSLEKYLNRDMYFQHIQRNVKSEIEKYPLADSLVRVHDICSEYGSHADVSSLFYRTKDINEEGIKKSFFNYFQVPDSFEETRYYFVLTLLAFLHMFIIFKVFFNSKLIIIDPPWEQKINDLRKKLESLIKRYSNLSRQGKIFNPNEVT